MLVCAVTPGSFPRGVRHSVEWETGQCYLIWVPGFKIGPSPVVTGVSPSGVAVASGALASASASLAQFSLFAFFAWSAAPSLM